MKKTSLAFALVAFSATASAQERRTVRVHVDSTNPNVVLETLDSGMWFVVCRGACDRDLPAELGVRVSGRGVQPSKKIVLPTSGSARISVDAARSLPHVIGLTSFFVGLGSVEIGLDVMLIGWLTNICSNCVDGLVNTTAVNVGWTMLGGGIVAMVVGGLLFATTSTSVVVTDAFVRVPTFERRAAEGPPAFGVPILSGRF